MKRGMTQEEALQLMVECFISNEHSAQELFNSDWKNMVTLQDLIKGKHDPDLIRQEYALLQKKIAGSK